MTIIVGYASHWFSACVGDRLTTVDRREHDSRANKFVVCRLADGFITIGFTGLAYIGDVPTDTWIAQQIVPTITADEGLSFRVHTVPRELRIVVSRLVVRLRSLASRDRIFWRHALQVGIIGCHVRRGDMNPYLLIIEKAERSEELRFSLFPREVDANYMKWCVWVSGGWASAKPDLTRQMLAELETIFPAASDAPDRIASVLKNAATAWADEEDVIGDEMMTVIHMPFHGRSEIAFEATPATPALSTAIAELLGIRSISYSPWILGNQTVAPPTQVAGAIGPLMVGGHPIHLRSGDADEGIMIGVQSRIPPP